MEKHQDWYDGNDEEIGIIVEEKLKAFNMFAKG